MPEAAPNVTSNSDEQSEDFLGSFYGYLSAASMVPNSILLILTAFFGHRLKTQPRLVISLIFVILMFTFTSVMVFVVFININAAIFLGVAGKLSHPPAYMGAVFSVSNIPLSREYKKMLETAFKAKVSSAEPQWSITALWVAQ